MSHPQEQLDANSERDVVETTVDPARPDAYSVGAVRAVASLRGVVPTELDPLHDVVDPEALNALFETRTGTNAHTEVRFQYEECVVRIDGSGTITAVKLNAIDR